MKLLLPVLLLADLACAADLGLLGIAHVAVRVNDLAVSRAYYARQFGFAEPFEFRDGDRTTVVFLKINERQYIELYPSKNPEEPRLAHVCLETSDIERLHAELMKMGLSPAPVVKARAGNLLTMIKDPDGQLVEFLQYLPGSMHRNSERKALPAGRISRRLIAAGVPMKETARSLAFYRDLLGFEQEPAARGVLRLSIPGGAGDYLELGRSHFIGLDTSAREAEFADPDKTRVRLLAQHMPFKSQWRAVASQIAASDPASFPYNWGEGVQAIGMMKAYQRTGNKEFATWVDDWLALYIPRGAGDLLKIDRNAPAPKPGPGYCGYWSPATASLYLYQAFHRPQHLKLAEETLEFIQNGADRSPEGALAHWSGNTQLWVDTLFMACPLLSGMAKVESQPDLAAESTRQIALFARHTQDPKTGLFYHMWDWQTRERSPGLWGRGNGWVLMSIADTIEALKPDGEDWRRMRDLARQMARGLATTQDSAGMWHTVLDDASSYPESSATAMFVYGLLKLRRLEALDDSVLSVASRAWTAINTRYVKNDVVTGASAGTTPKGGEYYKNVPLGVQTWGTGAYLMAGSEMYRWP